MPTAELNQQLTEETNTKEEENKPLHIKKTMWFKIGIEIAVMKTKTSSVSRREFAQNYLSKNRG